MDIQVIAVIVLVAVSALYVMWAGYRSLTGARSGCGSGCGKCAAPAEETKRPGMIQLEQVRRE